MDMKGSVFGTLMAMRLFSQTLLVCLYNYYTSLKSNFYAGCFCFFLCKLANANVKVTVVCVQVASRILTFQAFLFFLHVTIAVVSNIEKVFQFSFIIDNPI